MIAARSAASLSPPRGAQAVRSTTTDNSKLRFILLLSRNCEAQDRRGFVRRPACGVDSFRQRRLGGAMSFECSRRTLLNAGALVTGAALLPAARSGAQE